MNQSKTTIRKTMRQQRQQLSAQQRSLAALAVTENLTATELFKQSQHIAFYIADNGELDPQPLLDYAQQQQKHCYLPVLDGQHLTFNAYQAGDTLQKNRYGILEPIASTTCCSAPQLDLVLLPLVAFDKHGHRLGMGAGYYDRTFAFSKESLENKPALVGLAYEFQLLDELPIDPWDVPLQGIATDKQMIWSDECNTGS